MIKTTLKIDGMMCGMCESHINDTIRNSFKMISLQWKSKVRVYSTSSER